MSGADSSEAPSPGEFEAELLRIDAALARGDAQESLALAEALQSSTAFDGHPAGEPQLALRFAYVDLHFSHLQRAHDGARQAARKFRELAMLADEVDAWSLCSRTATALGRSVEAVDLALIATGLAEALPPGLVMARASTSLGMAYGWGHRYAQAMQAFDTAMQIAERFGDPAICLAVSVERHWVLAVQHMQERQGDDKIDRLAQVESIRDLLTSFDRRAAHSGSWPGSVHQVASSGALVCALLALWTGEGVEQAQAWLSHAEIPEGAPKAAAWLMVAQSWVRAELARREGDLEAAILHLSRMTTWARELEHLAMAGVGHRLAVEVHQMQGNPALALAELNQLLSLERKMQVRHLDGRVEFVRELVSARHSEQRIHELAEESSQYKRWAHEDALTGLPNLRRFDQCLTEWSAVAADTGRPLCVALIDVDRFKYINDTYTHPVGDRVLRTIAAEMLAQVRETDLPARWGGDEFAILFRDTDAQMAEQVAERLEAAIRDHDWSPLGNGMQVSVSVGVVEAQSGDTKQTLVARSDKAMYAKKQARHRAELERSVPRAVVQRLTGWLRHAHRVVLFVGSGVDEDGRAGLVGTNFGARSPADRQRFGHLAGLQTEPEAFLAYWDEWRQAQRGRTPLPRHAGVVDLANALRKATIVTERVDGMLARAGAVDVVELYGNAFRDRCSSCGKVNLQAEHWRCRACGDSHPTVRPDMVLLGERPDAALLAEAELLFKQADVVLLVDCDATTSPGAGLVEKARARGAKVVMLGTGGRTRRDIAEVSIAMEPATVLKVIVDGLKEPSKVDESVAALSAPAFEILCFLTGQGTDNTGATLDAALGWPNWQIEARLSTLPWMFPLPTRSQMNPETPVPTRVDFAMLAGVDAAKHGMRRAFVRMLRFYGFEWQCDRVERSDTWREGFASWVTSAGHHDLFISRILGALTLTGLGDEAKSFLDAVEPAIRQYRGQHAEVPLRHWRLAVEG